MDCIYIAPLSKALYNLCLLFTHTHTLTHTHTPTAIGCHARYQPARQEQSGVRCLAQGRFDTPRVGSNRRPSDCQTTALTSWATSPHYPTGDCPTARRSTVQWLLRHLESEQISCMFTLWNSSWCQSSAVTSSVMTREHVPVAAIHAYAITLHPPCFTVGGLLWMMSSSVCSVYFSVSITLVELNLICPYDIGPYARTTCTNRFAPKSLKSLRMGQNWPIFLHLDFFSRAGTTTKKSGPDHFCENIVFLNFVIKCAFSFTTVTLVHLLLNLCLWCFPQWCPALPALTLLWSSCWGDIQLQMQIPHELSVWTLNLLLGFMCKCLVPQNGEELCIKTFSLYKCSICM